MHVFSINDLGGGIGLFGKYFFLKKNLILLPITCLATYDISNILLALKASHNNKKEPYFSVYPAFSIFSFLKAL